MRLRNSVSPFRSCVLWYRHLCLKPGTAVSFVLLMISTAVVSAQDGIQVGNRRQLLLDERFVQGAKGIEFAVHSPRKTGDIIVASEPGLSLEGYHTVLFDSGRYHFWYGAAGMVLYLHSDDGIHWQKPNLNLPTESRAEGLSVPPNVVLGGGVGGLKGGAHGLMVFIDPRSSADERFKLVCNPYQFDGQLQIFASPDGVHWRRSHPNVITFDTSVKPHQLDSQNVIFWDDRLEKYVAYFRKNVRDPGPDGATIPRTRTVARAEAPILGFFCDAGSAREVLRADPSNVVKPHAAREGWTLLDVYTSGTIKYPWAQDAYLMFPTEYYHYGKQIAEFRAETPVNAGAVDTRFASSRDGISWSRYDHRSFVPVGMKGEFDSKRIYMTYGIVPARNDRELYMYYMGTSETHGWDRDDRNNRLLSAADLAPTGPTVLSRVVLRRDGFVSVRAGFEGGEFTTPVLRFLGSQLLLNLNTGASGELRIEIQQPSGEPYPGFALGDCDLIHTTNEINRVVRWKGSTSLEALAGKPVRLRWVLRDSDVFAFQFAERGGI